MSIPEIFVCHPTVFAIEKDYQIVVPMTADALVWITVGGRKYYDHSNGIIRSTCPVHKITVPAKALNEAGEYTVSYRKMIERKPYFSETEEVVDTRYKFTPVDPLKPIKIYHVSDSHGNIESASSAYIKSMGEKPDLLILNGDVADHSGDLDHILTIYRIASGVTEGTIPTVFSRGNHDLRGNAAELLAEYTPTNYGKSYYTFRIANIWGIILDTGEDKNDDHPEYGNTICCHAFREEETEFIKEVIEKKEYEAEGIEYRFLVSHVPFARANTGEKGGECPFNIETEIFTEWCTLVRENIKPDLMICGHTHKPRTAEVGGDMDDHGQPAPMVIGGNPYSFDGTKGEFTGCAITLDKHSAELTLVDSKGNKEYLKTYCFD